MEKPSSIKKGLAGGPHPIIKGAIVHRRGAFDVAAAVGAPVFAVWIRGPEAPSFAASTEGGLRARHKPPQQNPAIGFRRPFPLSSCNLLVRSTVSLQTG
jgi:hypothetical protein